jgi:hypothetical protein
MEVTFHRTGERRYDVLVDRDHAPAMIMHPAPGYDEYLPHDLLHFVAEAEWGIDDAVFGQLAAGGDAGSFWPREQGVANKWKHRGERLLKTGRGMKQSEQLAAVLQVAWDDRHGRRKHSEEWTARWRDRVAAIDDRTKLEHVLELLDTHAAQWHALGVGESITLEWPRPETRRPSSSASPASRAGRRDAAATRARSAGRVPG